ncbi:MAG: hypothetical protein GX921_05730, partial [Bacteroidales bacterium]|nr:hypothetical protein [Bacteroidales bacterium]
AVMAFKNKTSYTVQDGQLFVDENGKETVYNLSDYELRSNIEIVVSNMGVPSKRELILIPLDGSQKIKINFAEKKIKEVVAFLEDIQSELNIEIKSIHD